MSQYPKILRLSMSSIKKYLKCPKSWYFTYVLKIPQKTDYPRLCGREVHFFVALLHKEHSSDRKFWYKNINSARKAWFFTWNRALDENRSIIQKVSKDAEDKYGKIGWFCIKHYWEQNFDKPNPIFVEKKFTVPWSMGVELTGVFDQVRTLRMDWIKKRRPELFDGNTLSSLYNPEAIVDLKTGWSDYNIEEDDSDTEKVRKQFEIQRDIQGAAYALLYQKHFGKFPIGFLLYQLRNEKNNMFLVKGDLAESQLVLKDAIEHVIKNIRDKSFPRNINNHCGYCDYYMNCSGNGKIFISLPEQMPYFVTSDSEDKNKKVESPKQLKLKLKYKK